MTHCLFQVSTILRKNESLRSAEEIAVLASMTDEVKEINFRICRRQRTIERSKEIEDEHLILRSKCKKLANALQHAEHLVVCIKLILFRDKYQMLVIFKI